jgi:hypothetical protein
MGFAGSPVAVGAVDGWSVSTGAATGSGSAFCPSDPSFGFDPPQPATTDETK